LNALTQLDNLLSYPLIKEKHKNGEIRLHAWFYDVGTGEVEEWNTERKDFVTIGMDSSDTLKKRITAGVQHQFPFRLRSED
jgi:carbonic anhydrase